MNNSNNKSLMVSPIDLVKNKFDEISKKIAKEDAESSKMLDAMYRRFVKYSAPDCDELKPDELFGLYRFLLETRGQGKYAKQFTNDVWGNASTSLLSEVKRLITFVHENDFIKYLNEGINTKALKLIAEHFGLQVEYYSEFKEVVNGVLGLIFGSTQTASAKHSASVSRPVSQSSTSFFANNNNNSNSQAQHATVQLGNSADQNIADAIKRLLQATNDLAATGTSINSPHVPK